MNPEVRHRNAEVSTKKWLHEQYTTHGTAVDRYAIPECHSYEYEVARLGKNILNYVVVVHGEEAGKRYCSTPKLDWE